MATTEERNAELMQTLGRRVERRGRGRVSSPP
jgi:hypothetical protein